MQPIDRLLKLLPLKYVCIGPILFFLLQMHLDRIYSHLVFLDLFSLSAIRLLQELGSVKVGAFMPREVNGLRDSRRLGDLGESALLFDLGHVALKVVVEGHSPLHLGCFERRQRNGS